MTRMVSIMVTHQSILSMNPVIPLYIYCSFKRSEMLNFVGNGRCSRALNWSAEAACSYNGSVITYRYNIITSY